MLDNLSKESFNEQLNRYSTRELENLVQKFPYFHQAQVLLARKYQLENNPKFDEQLQMAALYVQDRELFYELFHTPPAIESAEIQLPVAETTLQEPVQESKPVTAVLEDFPVNEEPVIEVGKAAIEEKQETTEHFAPITVPQELPQEEPVLATTEEAAIIAPEPETEQPVTEAAVSENEPVTEPEAEAPVTVEETEVAEEKTEAPFSLIEPHTFDEWLHAFTKRDKTTAPTPLAEDEKALQQDEELDRIIAANANIDYLHELVKEETHYSKGLDKFIANQIQKHKAAEPVKNLAEDAIDPAFATETLAGIYEKQRKYAKAIKVYEALTLKFPEKSDLFAARIQYLKNCIDL